MDLRGGAGHRVGDPPCEQQGEAGREGQQQSAGQREGVADLPGPAHGLVEVHDGQCRPAVDLHGADGGDFLLPAVGVLREARLLRLHKGPEVLHLLELAHVELEYGLGLRVDHHHAFAVDDTGVARLADLDLGEPGRQGVGRHDRGDGADEPAVLHDGHAERQDGSTRRLCQDHVAHDGLHLGLGLLEVVPVPEVDADVLPAVGVGEPLA
ncbi:MAG: hypothetical protein A4E67_02592 [Syntrophaceae bacterium PtaB.Bin038]|nr:MAG: hypothetical protein A4E67_02592 [Syntrophaceae bacterium PtaB.Bin038]